MNLYECKHCGTVVTGTSSPHISNCPVGSSHHWYQLGRIGAKAYQCKNCSTFVSTDSSPHIAGCPAGSSHQWTSLGPHHGGPIVGGHLGVERFRQEREHEQRAKERVSEQRTREQNARDERQREQRAKEERARDEHQRERRARDESRVEARAREQHDREERWQRDHEGEQDESGDETAEVFYESSDESDPDHEPNFIRDFAAAPERRAEPTPRRRFFDALFGCALLIVAVALAAGAGFWWFGPRNRRAMDRAPTAAPPPSTARASSASNPVPTPSTPRASSAFPSGPTPDPQETEAARETWRTRAREVRDRAIEAARKSNAAAQQRELDRLQQEQADVTGPLLIQAKEYPRTPEVAQASYRAGKRAEEIQREYESRQTDVRRRSDSAFQRQKEKLVATCDAQIAAIDHDTSPAPALPEVRRAVAVADEGSSPSPRTTADADASSATYEVTGLAEGEFLNLRAGPGATYETVGKIPLGTSGIRKVGASVMNGPTEWVQIRSGQYRGWVNKTFVQAR